MAPFHIFTHLLNISADDTLRIDFSGSGAFYVSKTHHISM